nr:anti-sigma factor [Paenibacillus flagellatus]
MELMQRHLDRDLIESEQEAMMDHLQQCPECAEMFDRLRQLSQELASLPKVTPPFSLVDSILPQLAEIDRAGEGPFAVPAADTSAATVVPLAVEKPRRFRMGWTAAAAGGVVAAGLLLALFVNDMDGTQKVADDNDLLYEAGRAGASASRPASEATQNAADAPKADAKAKAPQAAETPGADAPKSESGAPAPSGSAPGSASGETAPKQAETVPDLPTEKVIDQRGGEAPRTIDKRGADAAGSDSVSGSSTGADTGADTGAASDAAGAGAPESAASDAPPAANAEAPDSVPQTEEPVYGFAGASVGGSGSGETADRNQATLQSKANEKGAPQEGANADRMMGIAAMPPAPSAELVSEDGLLVASIDAASRRIVVHSTGESRTEMFLSAPWKEGEQAKLVGWEGSVRLTYSVTSADGKTRTIVVDIAKETEAVQPQA